MSRRRFRFRNRMWSIPVWELRELEEGCERELRELEEGAWRNRKELLRERRELVRELSEVEDSDVVGRILDEEG